MPAEATVFTDADVAVRAWARTQATDAAGRVFFGVNNTAAFPQIVVARLGGRDESAGYTFHVWGGTKAQADQCAAQLATAIDAADRYTTAGVTIHSAAVDGVVWRPDPESDRPRKVIDATFVITNQ